MGKSAELNAEKCDMDMSMNYRFAGGAESFADYDSYYAAEQQRWQTQDMANIFRSLVENIWNDEALNLAQKASAVQKLTRELSARVAQIDQMEMGKSIDKDGKSIFSWFRRNKGEKMPSDNADTFHPATVVNNPTSSAASFALFRDKSGALRWLGIVSNNYEDREKEILSEESHKEYADWVERTGEYPPLRLWHLPGSDIGITDWVDYHDGFLVASGTVNPNVQMETVKAIGGAGIGMSIGFAYKSEWVKGGVFSKYRATELSVLPVEYAANPLTQFTIGDSMNSARKAWLERAIGPEKLNALVASLSTLHDSAQKDGLSSKSVDEMLHSIVDETNSGTTTNTDGSSVNSAGTNSPSGGDDASTGTETELEKSLAKVLEPLTNAVVKLDQRMTAIETGQKATEKSLDEQLAEILNPRNSLADAAKNSATFGNQKTVVSNDDTNGQAIISAAKEAHKETPTWAKNYEEWGVSQFLGLPAAKAGK